MCFAATRIQIVARFDSWRVRLLIERLVARSHPGAHLIILFICQLSSKTKIWTLQDPKLQSLNGSQMHYPLSHRASYFS